MLLLHWTDLPGVIQLTNKNNSIKSILLYGCLVNFIQALGNGLAGLIVYLHKSAHTSSWTESLGLADFPIWLSSRKHSYRRQSLVILALAAEANAAYSVNHGPFISVGWEIRDEDAGGVYWGPFPACQRPPSYKLTWRRTGSGSFGEGINLTISLYSQGHLNPLTPPNNLPFNVITTGIRSSGFI